MSRGVGDDASRHDKGPRERRSCACVSGCVKRRLPAAHTCTSQLVTLPTKVLRPALDGTNQSVHHAVPGCIAAAGERVERMRRRMCCALLTAGRRGVQMAETSKRCQRTAREPRFRPKRVRQGGPGLGLGLKGERART